MYKKLFVLILALAALGCRAKKETVQTSTVVAKSDSLNSSFKGSLIDTSFKQADVTFTTLEYEYPAQTPEEKKQGIQAKPRIKSKTQGVIHQTESSRKEQKVAAAQTQVSHTDIKKTALKQLDVKPVFTGFHFWLTILYIAIVIGLFLVWKFNLVSKIKGPTK